MRLRFEPWPPEYDTSLHDELGVTGDSAPFGDTNYAVELEQWRPVQTKLLSISFERLYFIDGRRRSEGRVFAEWETAGIKRSLPGLLGTYAVGLAEIETERQTSCRIAEAAVERVLILAHEGAKALHIPASESRLGELVYRPAWVDLKPASEEGNETQTDKAQANNSTNDTLELQLQALMRQAERRLASRKRFGNNLLIVDGTLPSDAKDPFDASLGYVKTIHNLRLPPEEQRTLFELQFAQRSPVFEIGGRLPRFSWYLRLDTPVDWYHSLSGIVRLEVYHNPETGRNLDWASRIADWSCTTLPRLAAKSYRDPRAPQQLMPVAALERELGRRMGDRGIVRRRIQRHLHEQHYTDDEEPNWNTEISEQADSKRDSPGQDRLEHKP